MTHYMVLVVGDNPSAILAPYSHHTKMPRRIIQTGDAVRKDMIEKIKMAKEKDPNCLRPHEKELLGINPDDMSDMIQWAKKWFAEEVDSEGNLWSDENQNEKYDYFVIGGRYAGSLILLPGREGKKGKKSWVHGQDDPYCTDNHIRVDQARVEDIDWRSMKREMMDGAGNDYLDHMEYISSLVQKGELKLASEIEKFFNLSGVSQDEYVSEYGYWAPYAIVDTKGWNSVGEAGYFGSSSESREERVRWRKTFYDTYIAHLPKKTIVTIVDCHR